jgi:MFS family permease
LTHGNSTFSAAAAATERLRPWTVLAGASITLAFCLTPIWGSTFGLFMLPLEQELGWTRAQISLGMTVVTLVGLAAGPVSGVLIDRLPVRAFTLACLLLQAALLVGFSSLGTSISAYYALCAVAPFVSYGASGLSLSKVVSGWFDRRRGLAVGWLFADGSVGAVLHPLIAASVLGSHGWRAAYLCFAVLIVLVGAGTAWAFVRERTSRSIHPGASPRAVPGAAAGDTLRDASRSSAFWVLAASGFLYFIAFSGTNAHFAPLLMDRGVALESVARALSLMWLGTAAGTLLGGHLLDRIDAARVAQLAMLGPAAGIALLLVTSAAPAATAAGSLLGLAGGVEGTFLAYIVARRFGLRAYGTIFATQGALLALGAGIGPWLSGYAYTQSGSYSTVLILYIALLLAAAALLFALWIGPRPGLRSTP